MKVTKASSLLLLATPCLVRGSNTLDLLVKALSLPRELMKGAMVRGLGMDPAKADKLFTPDAGNLESNPYTLDLNDTNWETMIRTGTSDPYATALPTDTTWAILVYGQDPVSRVMADAFNNVTAHNSSAAGGELPSNIRFARLNYGSETVLTTRWWMWKPPVLVLANYNLRELRFFTPGHIPPFHVPMSNLINTRDAWEKMPKWQTVMAPDGALEPYMIKLADGWAWYHRHISKLPNFALLAISGFIMNFIVGWFHKPAENKTKSAADKKDEGASAVGATSVGGTASGVQTGTTSATKRR